MSHATEFDEYGHKDHGHVIVSKMTLRFTLLALLFFTLATSGAAWAEQGVADHFHVEIPQWINAFVALSIAAVKTALVVMFFMQLKYDNPMNTIIFVFTILTVFSFLGFTSLDLGNRDTIDRFKNQYAYDGGNLAAGPGAFVSEPLAGESIVARAKRISQQKTAQLRSEIRQAEQKLTRLRQEQASAAGANPTESAKRAKEIQALGEELAEKRTELSEEGYDRAKEHHDVEGQSITEMGYLPFKPFLQVGGHRIPTSSSNISRPIGGVTIPGLPGYHSPTSPAESVESKAAAEEDRKAEPVPVIPDSAAGGTPPPAKPENAPKPR